MLMHHISVEPGVEPLNLKSPCKTSGEIIIELENSKILRDLLGQSPFFGDEVIEKKFNVHKESGIRLMAIYLLFGILQFGIVECVGKVF